MPDTNQVTRSTGRRKEAVARIRLMPGTGKITVNGREVDTYFHRPGHAVMVRQPLQVLEMIDKVDVFANVTGGGETGQAGAIRHGLARALTAENPDNRTALKRAGFLTRDPRAKERKKYGRPGARKRFQYSKR